ncbi:MAG TPA: RimK/LysX family protein [Candidatus Binatia bacterium]|nr:RimK/LysX family protein [Candidatus Binatia bacterium]
MTSKTVVGLTEKVTIVGSKNTKEVMARIDTGATKSSIDASLVKELELGPEIKKILVRSAHGQGHRGVVYERVIIGDRKMRMQFTVADRTHMKYKVLIGQNILKRGFLIDPSKEQS